MIAGGLLFGGLGALAGSIDRNGKKQLKTKSDFRVRLILDSLSQASIDLKCESSEKAYQILYTLSLLEEKYYKKINDIPAIESNLYDSENAKSELILNIEKQTEMYYTEIMRIKELYDQNIITLEEFDTLKKKIINS